MWSFPKWFLAQHSYFQYLCPCSQSFDRKKMVYFVPMITHYLSIHSLHHCCYQIKLFLTKYETNFRLPLGNITVNFERNHKVLELTWLKKQSVFVNKTISSLKQFFLHFDLLCRIAFKIIPSMFTSGCYGYG